MVVKVTSSNFQGVGSGNATLSVQCKGCDRHREREDDSDEEWITVGEDFNQSFAYAQAGVTVSVNQPQPFYEKDGKNLQVEWRALVSGQFIGLESGIPRIQVEFSSEPASDDGNTGGDPPPRLAGYDVANTDFFKDLDDDMEPGLPGFETVDPAAVVSGQSSLSGLDSLVLADNPLPGYNKPFGAASIGAPPGAMDISWSPTVAGAYDRSAQGDDRVPGTYTMVPFKITPDHPAGGLRVRIDWSNQVMDFDMYLYRRSSGRLILIGSSTGTQGTTNFEQIDVKQQLATGDYELYVDNYAAPDPQWTGKITFNKLEATGGGDSTVSDEQKDQWFAKLREWVEAGGNLVLTDGALRALPELVPGIQFAAISPTTVYAGQVTFASEPGKSTVGDDLAKRPVTIAQDGARFNSGGRRQTYEPTPLGFPVQQDIRGNDDSSYARQWDIDKATWEKAGGRTAGTSADSGARDAAPVFERVALGELKLGKGQIRVIGGLLPQPSTEYNHPFGIEPYAVTYTGYILTRNLLEVPQILSSPTIGGRFLISGRAVKISKNRTAGVRVSCRNPFTCTGTLKLQATVKLKPKKGSKKRRNLTITLGKQKFNIGNKSRNRVLQVPVKKSKYKYLLATRRLRVLATAPIRFADGRRGVARNSFWLYRPSRVRR
jgi:hypothetical protein